MLQRGEWGVNVGDATREHKNCSCQILIRVRVLDSAKLSETIQHPPVPLRVPFHDPTFLGGGPMDCDVHLST